MLKEKLKAYEEQKAYKDESGKTNLMTSNPQEKEFER